MTVTSWRAQAGCETRQRRRRLPVPPKPEEVYQPSGVTAIAHFFGRFCGYSGQNGRPPRARGRRAHLIATGKKRAESGTVTGEAASFRDK